MGVSTCKHVDAWHCHEPDRGHDRGKAPPRLCQGRGRRITARLIATLTLAWFWAGVAFSDTIRIATYNTELDRDGPGLLLRDILRGEDPQVAAIAQVIAHVAPDILVLQRVDYDLNLQAVTALRDVIAEAGQNYPHIFALRPNTGMQTGLDMDGDGRAGDAADAQGYGDFAGQSGMVVLSRYPVDREGALDFSAFLWRELPNALLPHVDGLPFPSPEALAIQRLSTVGHWVVPVRIDEAKLDLLVFHASPPVFDGPEDQNGKRNHDELVFWKHYMDGAFGPVSDRPFVLAGVTNLDPSDSDGRPEGMLTLLSDKRLQDPRPKRPGEATIDPRHKGDPRMDTAHWPAPGPGALRVDYILPSAYLTVTDAGVFWPDPEDDMAAVAGRASRHFLVWVDLSLDTR